MSLGKPTAFADITYSCHVMCLQKVTKIVMVMCVLYNFLITRNSLKANYLALGMFDVENDGWYNKWPVL